MSTTSRRSESVILSPFKLNWHPKINTTKLNPIGFYSNEYPQLSGKKTPVLPIPLQKKPHIEASKINMSTPKDIPYLALGEKQRKIIPWLIRRQIEEDSTRNK